MQRKQFIILQYTCNLLYVSLTKNSTFVNIALSSHKIGVASCYFVTIPCNIPKLTLTFLVCRGTTAFLAASFLHCRQTVVRHLIAATPYI